MDGESRPRRTPHPHPFQRWSRAPGQRWVSHDCGISCHDDGWARLVGAASCPSLFLGTSRGLTGTLWHSTCPDVALRLLARRPHLRRIKCQLFHFYIKAWHVQRVNAHWRVSQDRTASITSRFLCRSKTEKCVCEKKK